MILQRFNRQSVHYGYVEEIRKVTESVCPKGHSFEIKSENGKCNICSLKLQDVKVSRIELRLRLKKNLKKNPCWRQRNGYISADYK